MDFTITNTLEEAAGEIQKSSFAIYRVPPATWCVMKETWRQAADFLDQSASKPNRARKEWTRIVNGHLFGYNEPSPAKRLFRAFTTSKYQPWPEKDFQRDCTTLAAELHDILVKCCNNLQGAGMLRGKSLEVVSQPESKRRRLRPQFPSNLGEAIDREDCPLDFFFYHNRESNAVNCSEHID